MVTLYINEVDALVGEGESAGQWTSAIGHAVLDVIRDGKPCTISLDAGDGTLQRFFIPPTAVVRLAGTEDGFVMAPVTQKLSAEYAKSLGRDEEITVSLVDFRRRFGVVDNGL